MRKIVKYCSTCEESFARKFVFCPNCANELSTFDMKPVDSEPEFDETVEDAPALAASAISSEDVQQVTDSVEETTRLSGEVVEEVVANEPEVEKAAAKIASTVKTLFGAERIPESASHVEYSSEISDDYRLTVVDESIGSLRKSLMLCATVLVLTLSLGAMLYSIFNHPFFVASIDHGDVLQPFDQPIPIAIDEARTDQKKDGDKRGGGGGSENKKAASDGEPPTQTTDRVPPLMPVERMKKPSLSVVNKTEGDIKKKRTTRIGLKNGVPGELSSGPGRNGGFGTGVGPGFGGSRGPGEGPGIESGDPGGTGRKKTGRRPTAPPKRAKSKDPVVNLKVLSNPRPSYTEKARRNSVTGNVILRVTFLNSGRIGSISTVKGLPHGLTEKAIAAARQIRFTPQKIGGRAQSVKKTIVYNFTIY